MKFICTNTQNKRWRVKPWEVGEEMLALRYVFQRSLEGLDAEMLPVILGRC